MTKMAESLVAMAYSLAGNPNTLQKSKVGEIIKGVANILKAARKEGVVFSTYILKSCLPVYHPPHPPLFPITLLPGLGVLDKTLVS